MQKPDDLEVEEPVGRNLVLLEQDRVAEVVPLKQRKALRASLAIVLLRVYPLGNQHIRGEVHLLQIFAFFGIEPGEIYPDVVGQFHYGVQLCLLVEIVNRNPEPLLF